MTRRLCNIPALLCALFYLYPASAQEALTSVNFQQNLPFKGIYSFGFSGIPFGKMGIEMQPQGGEYRITTDVALTGLITIFVQHSSHTTAAEKDGDVFYETHYHTRNKPRSVKMVYKNGLLAEEQSVPLEGPGKRPPIPMELKKDSVDPLTLIVRMRQGLHDALAQHKPEFVLKAYDGRRLSEVHFVLQGKKTITIGDTKYVTNKVAISRLPLGGYDAEEMQAWQAGEPPLYAYFSDDGRLIPLRMEARKFGVLSATLVRECGTGESCLLGMKE